MTAAAAAPALQLPYALPLQMTLPIAVPDGLGHERMANIAPGLWDTIVTQIIGRAYQLLEQMRGCPRCATMVLRVVLDRYRPVNGDRVWPSNEFIFDEIERLFPAAKASLRSIERAMGYLKQIGLRKIVDQDELLSGPGAWQYPEELRRADQLVPTWDIGGILRLVSDQFTQMIASAGKALFAPSPAPPLPVNPLPVPLATCTMQTVPDIPASPVLETLLEDLAPPDLPPDHAASSDPPLSKVEIDNVELDSKENKSGSGQAAEGGLILPPNLADRNKERAHAHVRESEASVFATVSEIAPAAEAAPKLAEAVRAKADPVEAIRTEWPKRVRGRSALKHHVARQMIAAMGVDWCRELCLYGRWAISTESGIAGTIGDVGAWTWGTYKDNRKLREAGVPYPWPDAFVDHLKRLGPDGRPVHRVGDLVSIEAVEREMARDAAQRRLITAPQPPAIASSEPIAPESAALSARWVGASGIGERPAELLAVWNMFLHLARRRLPERIYHWYVADKLLPLRWDAAERSAVLLCASAEGREKLVSGLHTEKLAEALRDALGLPVADVVRVRLVDAPTASATAPAEPERRRGC